MLLCCVALASTKDSRTHINQKPKHDKNHHRYDPINQHSQFVDSTRNRDPITEPEQPVFEDIPYAGSMLMRLVAGLL